MFKEILREAFVSGSLNTTFSIVLAALLHSGMVKREIKIQVSKITASINGVTAALKIELSAQSGRIENIEMGVSNLSGRVDALEKKGE